jgi:hypothetical protein
MAIYTDPASGRQYSVDDATGETRWLNAPAPPQLPALTFTDPNRPKPKTVAGIAGTIIAGFALLISWIPLVNNLAAIVAIVSGICGIVGMVATRPAGKRSARWAGVTALLLSVLAIVAVIATQAFFMHAINGVNNAIKSAAPTVPTGSIPAAPAASSSAPSGVATFGSVVTFADKSTLTCTKPVSFVRDQYAAGGQNSSHFLKSKCTFVNNSANVFNPSLTSVSMSAGGAEGDQIFQDGLGTPTNPVLPSRSVSWVVGFGVDSTSDVQLTVRLGFLNYAEVTFT